jgi:hypothetical protein
MQLSQFVLFFVANFLWNMGNVFGSRSKMSNSATYLCASSGLVSVFYILSLIIVGNLLLRAHAAGQWGAFAICVALYGISSAAGAWGGWKLARDWEKKHGVVLD